MEKVICRLQIAHIGNTAGVATLLAEEQRNRNNTVEVFVFNELLHKQFGGTFIDYRIRRHDQSLNVKWFLERRKLFKRLQMYDVWHYHYPYGSLKRNVAKHLKDQILLNHYHGDDIRNKMDNNFCVVSTPDLLKFAPNGVWVPNPVNVNYISQFVNTEFVEHKPLKVAHYPYYKNYSTNLGLDYFSSALRNLERRGKCQVVTILRQDYTTTLKMLSHSDVVIGKILPIIGWFGKFELEGMVLGKPVITYISDELFEKYRPPVYRTTKDTFEKDLETLLEDATEQKRLKEEARAYVVKNHSVNDVCDLIQKCYEKCKNFDTN